MRNVILRTPTKRQSSQSASFTHPQLGRLVIKPGLTPKQITELISFSKLDQAINRFTLDSQRFRNRQTYAKWLKKGRFPYTLSNQAGNLLGLIWFRQADFPPTSLLPQYQTLDPKKYQITFAVRTYGLARGRGIAKDFIQKTISLFQQSPQCLLIPGQGLWLTTSLHNLAAVNTYRTIFTQVSQPSKEGKIVMVQIIHQSIDKNTELQLSQECLIIN